MGACVLDRETEQRFGSKTRLSSTKYSSVLRARMLMSKGHYEVTHMGTTVLTDPHLLSAYYFPGIARPWLSKYSKAQNNKALSSFKKIFIEFWPALLSG